MPNKPPLGWEILPTTQAGEHENLTTEFSFEHNVGNPLEKTDNEAKTTIVDLPPGFTGNNLAVPTCTDQQLSSEFVNPEEGEPCPPDSQVGTISLTLDAYEGGLRVKTPVFNMVSVYGTTSTLGFNVLGYFTQDLQISVRPSDDGLTVTSPAVPRFRLSPLNRGSRGRRIAGRTADPP